MAQRKQLTWAELRVGVFVLVGLFIVMIATFYVTGAGFLGPKYRLYTYLPDVEQLKTGAPVNLDGVEVGNVQSLSLNPHPQDHLHSVQVVLRINKGYQKYIRTDSFASLDTQGLLGDTVVTISRGVSGSIVPANGEIAGRTAAGTKEVVERSAQLMDSLTTLSTNVNDVVAQIQQGKGSIGKLMEDPALYNNLRDTTARIDAMAASIQQGQGTVGKLVASDELYRKVDATMDDVHDMSSALRQQKGSLGKLIYDPSAYNEVNGLAQKGNALLGDVREGKGTLGKLATDDTLYNNVRDVSANLRDASAKLNSNQGTAGKFFTDPALYDNLTGLTGDMRLMISDFRQNPKKFLHIKLGIF